MKNILLLNADCYYEKLISVCQHLNDEYLITSVRTLSDKIELETYDLIISIPTSDIIKCKTPLFFIVENTSDLNEINQQDYNHILNGNDFLESCYETISHYFEDADQFITIENKKIHYNKIMYITVDNHYTIIHTSNKIYYVRSSLKSYEAVLKNYRFFKSHYSYIVNLFYVSKIQANCIILKNEEKIPISRRYANSYHLQYLKNEL